jgi:phosphatidylserine/phosphatidylglycerophosphate/cardiolipin synthase-like enzyme/uncharacterized membrane protein YdjX (TVP38/TMEM64 family)
MSLLQEGRNCWRITRASRLAFLVDGEEYFKALELALRAARRSIDIVAWDISSRLNLRPDLGRGRSVRLGALLGRQLREQPDLRVRLLVWWPPFLYTFYREWFQRRTFRKHGGAHLSICLDDQQPMGASQHQKLTVVDGGLAFTGGFDPTVGRWDTRAHRPHNPRRRHPVSHDVQVCVTGPAAAALGELVADRWRHACNQTIELPPAGMAPDIDIPWHAQDVRVGIARTFPPFRDRPAVNETYHLYRDLIAGAREDIFIENQYFTSALLADAIGESLQRPDGPRVTVILPKSLRDGAANILIDVLRWKRLNQLREADRHRRLLVLYPRQKGVAGGVYIHSKVLVVDDEYAMIGSSNCTDRSMGVDSECDLVVDAEGRADVRQAIRDFREGLLAEHSGLDLTAFREELRSAGSLRDFVERHARHRRALRPFRLRPFRWWERRLTDLPVVDGATPTVLDRLIDTTDYAFFHAAPEAPSRRRFLVYLFLIGAGVIGFSFWAAWHGSDTEGLIRSVFLLAQSHPAASLVAVGLFVAAGAFFVPYAALVLATATVFPAALAVPITLIGGTLSAVTYYGVGRLLGAPRLERVFSDRIKRLGELIRGQRVLSVALLRQIPIAPFTVVNLIAGAFRVPFRTYTAGTIIGLLPGAFALIAFQRSLLSFIHNPQWQSGFIFAGVLLFFLWIGWLLRRRVGLL